jgi:hypothetical protein
MAQSEISPYEVVENRGVAEWGKNSNLSRMAAIVSIIDKSSHHFLKYESVM